MKIENRFLRYLRNIVLIILVFYIGTILGYVILGKGSIIDALSLKSIKHIKDIIYN
ncbi:DNA-directed RNA polymerase subunit beta [Gemella cuniculi]|uniref:DNA-directed RNA polymerase subunit beta n=1 Tax=Gemella cuniculi TaxID=150240 RepID=UPI00042335AA|nr:DNA-directed RNA polymerase subunit beta [Gemella cuniculi]